MSCRPRPPASHPARRALGLGPRGGLALMAVLLAGCGPVIPRVTPELVHLARQHDAAISDTDLERTRELYVNRCGSCHALNDPRDYTPGEWADWMRKMGRKSKLTGHQEADLLVFVLAARELPPEP